MFSHPKIIHYGEVLKIWSFEKCPPIMRANNCKVLLYVLVAFKLHECSFLPIHPTESVKRCPISEVELSKSNISCTPAASKMLLFNLKDVCTNTFPINLTDVFRNYTTSVDNNRQGLEKIAKKA